MKDEPINPVSLHVRGTRGYEHNIDAFLQACESLDFNVVHAAIMPLLPTAASYVLDVGAGSGRDAAALADLGHRVVAIEPFNPFRLFAQRHHPNPRITWHADALPQLASLHRQRFDVIMVHAVWMHLDATERPLAMSRLAGLLANKGVLFIALRHGSVPTGKRMFAVSTADTIALAERAGLEVRLRLDRQASAFNRSDVTWTRLAFGKCEPNNGSYRCSTW